MSSRLKTVLRMLALITASPLIILDLLVRPLGSDNVFAAFSQLLSLFPGKSGSYLRIAFYRAAMRHCHGDCFIGFGTLFSQRDTQISQGVYIGPQCNIGASRIGRDTLIASGVHIMSGTQQHRFIDLEQPIRDQGGEFIPVSVGEDSWIGNGALVMADVGNKCVIGAGSVVTRPIPDFAIAVGNPARVLRMRSESGADGGADRGQYEHPPETQRGA